jgi:hypothetical protein
MYPVARWPGLAVAVPTVKSAAALEAVLAGKVG